MIDKQFYRDLTTPNGYVWCGFLPESGLHIFQRGNYQTGFYNCFIHESDIRDGSYMYMLDRDLSRVESHPATKRHHRQWVKANA